MMEPEFVLKVHQNELLSLKSQMNLRRENVSCSARKLVEFCLDMTPKVNDYCKTLFWCFLSVFRTHCYAKTSKTIHMYQALEKQLLN